MNAWNSEFEWGVSAACFEFQIFSHWVNEQTWGKGIDFKVDRLALNQHPQAQKVEQARAHVVRANR